MDQKSQNEKKRHHYIPPLPEGGRDNNTLENFFSTIESTWPPLVDRLRSGSAAGSDMALYTFISLMKVRIPAVRDMIEILRAEQVKAAFRLLDQAGKLPSKPKDQSSRNGPTDHSPAPCIAA